MPEPTVGLIMGSDSDWKTLKPAAERLEALGVRCEARVVSAHRTPDDLFAYAEQAEGRGLSLIIAGAGGAAHLPGMTAAKTVVPVVGVPVAATALRGIDALLSILQMPAEIGVATVGVGATGAERAAVFAARALTVASRRVAILAGSEPDLELMENAAKQLREYGIEFADSVEGAGVVIVGGLGLAAQVAATTTAPVLAVPIASGSIDSIDRFVEPLLDLPAGVASFAVGRPGAINAGLFAAAVLSAPGSETRLALRRRRDEQVTRVRAMTLS